MTLAVEIFGWTLVFAGFAMIREPGVSNALISQIETNKIKNPGFSTVVRLCEALGISIERAAQTASLKVLKSMLRK